MPAEPGPALDYARPLHPTYPWREMAPALSLLLTIALVGLVGRALVGGTGAPAAARSLPPRPRVTTPVLVLNGNGVAGAAGGVTNRLLNHGYRRATAANAQVTTYARSLVLFRPGWDAEAERLANDAGIRAVAPLDGRIPAGNPRYPLVAIVAR